MASRAWKGCDVRDRKHAETSFVCEGRLRQGWDGKGTVITSPHPGSTCSHISSQGPEIRALQEAYYFSFLTMFNYGGISNTVAAGAKTLESYPTLRPHRRQPTRLRLLWDSAGKNTAVGCRFLLQCMKVKSESEVALSCPTLMQPTGSSVHGIFQARVLEWGAIAFSKYCC